MFYLYDSSVDF